MKCLHIRICYIFALIIDSLKVLTFSGFIFNKYHGNSITAYTFTALLCIAPVLWFSVMLDEAEYHYNLKTLSIIKVFSVLAGLVFFIAIFTGNIFSADLYLQFNYAWFFMLLDSALLMFCILRESRLCR